MPEANIVTAHMEVLGSDDVHVGTVDHVEDHRIKLTKAGSADGAHHYLPTSLIGDIRGNSVRLTITAAEAESTAQA